MQSSQLRVLVVEDNLDVCTILKGFFGMQPQIEWVGEAHDGLEALEKIYFLNPDILILDVIMPICDGLYVLEHLKNNPPATMPIIILTSAGGHDIITRQSVELGADYFMLKPYSLDILLNRMFMLSAKSNEDKNNDLTETESRISNFVISLGVPIHILGYQYITDALTVLLSQTTPCPIGKKVYSAIAKKNSTTEDCVERAIRQALVFVRNNKTNGFCTVMKYCNAPIDKRLTNAQFLKMVAEYLRLNK
ncbi:MAG: response regulator [Oscillospiraceae bacterium]